LLAKRWVIVEELMISRSTRCNSRPSAVVWPRLIALQHDRQAAFASILFLDSQLDEALLKAYKALQNADLRRRGRPGFWLMKVAKARDDAGINSIGLRSQHLTLRKRLNPQWVYDTDQMSVAA